MTVCMLLAAGSSSRMGQPKMLLNFNNKTLLQHLIDEVKLLQDSLLLVITGCYHSLLKDILQQQDISFTENTQWKEGMGTSIQKGVKYVLSHYNNADNIIILVCDQPYISSCLLQDLIQTKKITGKGIVTSTYAGTTGTPVLFDKKYFALLSLLQGTQGAKKLVQQFIDDSATVDFPLGAVDIDTPGDYSRLKEIN